MNATASARVPFWTLLPVRPSPGESAVVMIAWLAVVLLGLTGHQRKAAKIASISLMLALLALLTVSVSVSAILPGGFF